MTRDQIVKLLGTIIGTFGPLSLAIGGYFVMFGQLHWLYLAPIFLIWNGAAFAAGYASDFDRTATIREIALNGFAWVWIAAIPASIWFVLAAIFFNGSWWALVYSFVVGSLSGARARAIKQMRD